MRDTSAANALNQELRDLVAEEAVDAVEIEVAVDVGVVEVAVISAVEQTQSLSIRRSLSMMMNKRLVL